MDETKISERVPGGYGDAGRRRDAPPMPIGNAAYVGHGDRQPVVVTAVNSGQVPFNTFALLSLLFSIFWLFAVGSVLGIVFGAVALFRIRKSRVAQSGTGAAIAGIAVGIAGLAPVLVLIVITTVPNLSFEKSDTGGSSQDEAETTMVAPSIAPGTAPTIVPGSAPTKTIVPGSAAENRTEEFSVGEDGYFTETGIVREVEGTWIVSLRSVDRQLPAADLERAVRDVRNAIPEAQTLYSDSYLSLRPGYVVVFVGPFRDARATWDYCNSIDRSECFGALLSQNVADQQVRIAPGAPRP